MIDIQTFMLALGIGNISFAVLMAGYTHGAGANPGLRLWMWARVCMGLTQLATWLRPLIGVSLLMGMEPIGWVVGVTMEVAAYCVFFGFPRWRGWLATASGAALALMFGASLAGATSAQLTALVAIIIATSASVMAVLLLRPRRRGASLLQRIIGANDAVFAIAMGLWAWSGIDLGPIASAAASPIQAFAYVAGYLLMIVNGFGFLLLCKQRDDAQMERLATVDFLTGLLNRRAFFEQADSARMLAARLKQPMALMMLDIDHFKQINDRLGHATGDAALSVFADTARAELRDHDVMGRIGGEEFALALPGTDLSGALHAAERLRRAIGAAAVRTQGEPHRMTVSIGVVLVKNQESLTAALARADHALYAAKRAGRNRVESGETVAASA